MGCMARCHEITIWSVNIYHLSHGLVGYGVRLLKLSNRKIESSSLSGTASSFLVHLLVPAGDVSHEKVQERGTGKIHLCSK
jgi:hypothetical protein